MMAPVGPPRPHPAPHLDRGVQLAILAVTAMGSSGLLLAVLGWFRPWTAVPAAAATLVVLVWLTRPTSTAAGSPATGPAAPGAAAAGAVALAVVVAVTGFHAVHHGEHLLADRDPGVYVTTARWLAAEGQLLVPTPDDPFAEVDSGIRRDLGFHHVGGDPTADRVAQFPHLLPVLLAWGHWIGGTTGLLATPAVLGGLALAAVWAFASRLLRPWAATAAVTALAVGPLHLFFTRDAYSEPLSQMLLFGGLVLVLAAVAGGSPRHGLVGGLLLGALVQARIDGVGLLVLVPLWFALTVWGDPARRRGRLRAVVAVAAGAALAAGLGLVDLRWRSPVYLDRLAGELLALSAALVVVAVAAVVLAAVVVRRPPVGEVIVNGLGRAAPVLGLVVLLVGLGAWLLRPLVVETRGDPSPFVVAIQEAEGSTVDPTLRYSEDSVRWLQWYLGAPAVALGLLGGAAAVSLRARRLEADALSLLVLASLGVTVLYLWRPSISPDHLWVMRRYLVVTVPAFVLLAAWVVDRISARWVTPGRAEPLVAGLVVLLAIAGPAAVAAWPLRSAGAQPGVADAIAEVCDTVGEDAAVAVVPEDNLSLVAPLALRSWCGVPVGVVGVQQGPEAWADLAARWEAAGRQLHVVARTPEAVRLVVPDAEPVVVTASGEEVERTLTRPARHLVERSVALAVAPVPSPAG